MHKKILSGIGIALCALAVIGIIVYYSIFTSSHIFAESANHLKEVYYQVNSNYIATVERNWRILNGWTSYISEKADNGEDEALAKFMTDRKNDWNFTNFYFISSDGTGMLLNGETRDLGFSKEQLDKLNGGSEIVHDGKRDGEVEITIFAIPTTNGVYRDFEYTSMGITFDNDDMRDTLNIDAFSGEGICYVIDGNGKVLVSSEPEGSHFKNFFEHLADEGTIKKADQEKLEKDLEEGNFSVTIFSIHGKECYLTYLPLEIDGVRLNDWMMLGVVPSAVLNKSMDEFRSVTMGVMAGIFVLLGVAIVSIIIIINRRRVYEKEVQLKSRDGLFDMLTLNTNDIYILFSPKDFKSEYVSPNVERVLGIKAVSVWNDVRNIVEAGNGDVHKFTTEGLKKLPKEQMWETELPLTNVTNREEYWYKLMLYRSEFNGSDSFVMMLSDRTKERKMNEDLEQALDLARAANSAKSNFLSNMSHDIRTPMNAIIGFATLLARNADKPDIVREYVKKIAYSGQHLLGLINDVLDMSKIESGKTSLNIEEFSMPEFLEALYTMVLPQTKSKNQSFDMHTKGNLPDLVLGDRLRLNQILLNLLSNAVKYTPEGGNIELCIEEMEQNIHQHIHLCFMVKDNGYGMSEEFVKTIFDSFSREVTEKTKGIQGTGLGMAITKNIVDLMGGTISVESKLGAGSTFRVELELATAEKIDDEEFWTRHNITRALVVDDEEDICLNIKDLMRDTGVEITYALSGEKAIECVKESCKKDEEFNIILLDWKMPGMDGLETAKNIRSILGDQIPILVLTSYNFDEIEEKAKNSGIDFFLPKPFFMSSFRRAIETVHGNKESDTKVESKDISINGLKVLAAEDNEINAEILTELLGDEGVTCDLAHNGREAVEMFEKCKPGQYDLILMDVQMPVMDGYEATRAIRACAHPEAKTIPILAMTANAFDDDVKKALDSGMNAHMAKPIDIEKMKATIAGFKGKKK